MYRLPSAAVRNCLFSAQHNYVFCKQVARQNTSGRLHSLDTTKLLRNNILKTPRRLCNTQQVNKSEFTEFYRFPYIVTLRVISRLKLYQTVITLVACPSLAIAHYMELVDLNSVLYFTAISLVAVVMLFVITYYLRRAIGIIGVNQDLTQVRVSHLTFWGHRRDVIHQVQDVVPISETTDQISQPYVTLKFYNSKDFYFYSIRYGNIVNRKLFEHVMGKII